LVECVSSITLIDVGDLARRLLDPRHRIHRLRHHSAAAVGDLARAGGEGVGLLGVLGVLLHRGGDLLHRGRGLFQAGGLLLGTLRQVGRAGGDSAAVLATSRVAVGIARIVSCRPPMAVLKSSLICL